jgi:Tfp pilus assembly protein PilF
MRRAGILLIHVFTLLACVMVVYRPATAEHFPNNLTNDLQRITAAIYDDDFRSADSLITARIASPEQAPYRYLFRAILYQAEMMAAESDFREVSFFAALDSVDDHAQRMLDTGVDSALAWLFVGHAAAFRSLYHGRAGHFWSAISNGLTARNAYTKGYHLDPFFHDLAFGLGSYRYWKSVKTRLLSWTPLFKNERQAGIALLHLAADSSEISRDAAQAALIWIYINEKRYGEALGLTDEMLARYPRGLTFLWAKAKIFFDMEDRSAAAQTYETILTRLRTDPGNYYNVVEAAYYLSLCYRATAPRDPQSNELLASLQKEVASLPLPRETQKCQKKKLAAILKQP